MQGVDVVISIDDRLLARIDRAARERGLSRSAYIADIASRHVGTARDLELSERAKPAPLCLDGILARLPHGDPTRAIRSHRDG
jgi:metal-responsive CopG/Arc/MetJ family transcriptional regulator